MGKRGPAPKPTIIKMREGNPGKRKLNDQEPDPPELDDISPPSHLSADAAKEWRKMAGLLSQEGLLKSLDLNALEVLCEHTAAWRKAMAQLTKTGMIIKTPNGFLVPNPLLSVVNKQAAIMHKMMAEFGMSPSARTRIKVTPDEQSPNQEAQDIIGF